MDRMLGEMGGLKILADLHHGGLYHSLQLMANDLGAEIYRPIGLEWFENGFFGIAEPYGNDLSTIRQFLEPSELPIVHDAPAINYGSLRTDSVYVCRDFAHESYTYGISFDTFCKTEFDIIIASIPYHIDKYHELRNKYQPNAKIIYQIGNPGWSLPPLEKIPNVLDSVGMLRDDQLAPYHYIRYHQQFEESVFFPALPSDSRNVSSLVLFPENHGLFQRISTLLSGYNFVAYGYSPPCQQPQITGISNIAKVMHGSRFGWHYKSVDGYGHIIHNWFACGRPVIASYGAYHDRQARNLLVDRQTGLDLDGKSDEDIVSWFKETEDPSHYQYLVDQVNLRYRTYVDFDKERKQLAHFFDNLL